MAGYPALFTKNPERWAGYFAFFIQGLLEEVLFLFLSIDLKKKKKKTKQNYCPNLDT